MICFVMWSVKFKARIMDCVRRGLVHRVLWDAVLFCSLLVTKVLFLPEMPFSLRHPCGVNMAHWWGMVGTNQANTRKLHSIVLDPVLCSPNYLHHSRLEAHLKDWISIALNVSRHGWLQYEMWFKLFYPVGWVMHISLEEYCAWWEGAWGLMLWNDVAYLLLESFFIKSYVGDCVYHEFHR